MIMSDLKFNVGRPCDPGFYVVYTTTVKDADPGDDLVRALYHWNGNVWTGKLNITRVFGWYGPVPNIRGNP